mmetsp:Transcript_8245/g.22680  ORF Transcript_8245/g.22680 Transcript_8245/m.22680 type:complete len:217 (-) Transcript_8245:870-1520(-)
MRVARHLVEKPPHRGRRAELDAQGRVEVVELVVPAGRDGAGQHAHEAFQEALPPLHVRCPVHGIHIDVVQDDEPRKGQHFSRLCLQVEVLVAQTDVVEKEEAVRQSVPGDGILHLAQLALRKAWCCRILLGVRHVARPLRLRVAERLGRQVCGRGAGLEAEEVLGLDPLDAVQSERTEIIDVSAWPLYVFQNGDAFLDQVMNSMDHRPFRVQEEGP